VNSLTKTQKIFWLLVFISLFILAGCEGGPQPYFEMGMGYTVNRDPLVSDELYGRDPTAHFAVGLDYKIVDKREWYIKLLCQYDHWSHYRDGWPFNENPEVHKDELMCGFRAGGQ
jgi:hypothetical protein